MMAEGNSKNGLGDPINKPFLGLTKHSEIEGDRLPSNGDVLRFFLYGLDTNISRAEIAKLTGEKLLLFYRKLRIPTIEPSSVTRKVTGLFDKYMKLKHESRFRTNPQLSREMEFEEKLDDLFDISKADALETLERENKNVAQFLEFQRLKGRPTTMTNLSVGRRIGVVVNPIQAETDELASNQAEVPPADISSPSSNSSQNYDDDDDDENDPSFVMKEKKPSAKPRKKKPRKHKKEIITNRVASVMDRYKFHTRGVVQLILAILEALQLNAKDYNVSVSAIYKRRKEKRKLIATAVRDSFSVSKGAVVHFDGKLMSSLTGHEKEDRIAVKVTCGKVDQFLG